MLQTRTDVKAVPCERCRIIRSFIMFVILLVLLGLVAGDKLAYLNFLDAEFFATLIIIVGGIGFIVKLVYWKFFSQSDTDTTSDPVLISRPMPAGEKPAIGKSSHKID